MDNPQPTPALKPPDFLSGLPRWQRQYLSARAAGSTEHHAILAARSSATIIQNHYLASKAGTDGGKFARAYDAIVMGIEVAGGREAVRARHLESADAILDRFSAMALGQLEEQVRHRDQISAGDRVLAAVQLVGQGASAVTQAVQVNLRIDSTGAAPPLRVIQVPGEEPPPGAGLSGPEDERKGR